MPSSTTAPAAPRLLVEERHRQILDLLAGQDRLTVEELVARFGVSAVTIRGDLDRLAANGAVIRSHGGAILNRDRFPDVPHQVRARQRHGEKARIARAAVRLIQPGETIILDSGTTTTALARELTRITRRSLTVITNAPNIAVMLAALPHVHVLMVGGMVRQASCLTVGPQAESTLKGLNVDRLFLGIDALDAETGLSTPDVLEAEVNRLMIAASRDVTAVTDSSKLGRRSLAVISDVSAVHRVITDDSADPSIVSALRARGTEVILV